MKAIQIKRKQKNEHGQYVEVSKDYYPVVERVKHFRESGSLYDGWKILTEVINFDSSGVLMVARIVDNNNQTISTGHAYERSEWGNINTHSMVENCETSAVGRALAFLNIGITDDIASADEIAKVERSEVNYDATQSQYSIIEELLNVASIPESSRNELYALCEQARLTYSRAAKAIEWLKENAPDQKKELDRKLNDPKS